MRIVVTGAAGFIGSHLSEALVAEGHDVVGVDCFTDYYPRADKLANLAALVDEEAFELVELDLAADDLTSLLDGADVAVNLAAAPGLVRGWDSFETYQTNNVRATKCLLDACLEAGVGHLIHASTSSVYGAEATGPEDSPTQPVSPYGVTKLAAEHLLQAHHATHGLPLTILRFFSIYGPRQRPDMAYRIFCERLLRGEPLVVYGDGCQTRSNTYVGDAAAGVLRALEGPRDGAVFNIGGGQEIKLLDAIAVLAAELGVEPEIEHRPARRGDQRRTVADVRRARAELGWAPQVDARDGLALELAWVRQVLEGAGA